METFFNIIHYCLYKTDYKMHLLANKLNPFALFGRIPAMKRKFQEQGTTLTEVVDNIWGDKRYGFSIMMSGAELVIAIFLIFMAVYDILNGVMNNPIHSSELPVIICALLAYTICHSTVFKADKYLKYFQQFEKWSKAEKWKYGLLTFAFIAASIVLCIYSFRYLP
ncbi:MAG: hypothetical protein ACK5JL_08045 [Candidatus Kapaibacterium sp.]|jgi:hypothetical protein